MFANKENIEKYKRLVSESGYLRNSIEVMNESQINESNKIQNELIDDLLLPESTSLGNECCKHVLIASSEDYIRNIKNSYMNKLTKKTGYQIESVLRCPNCGKVFIKLQDTDFLVSYVDLAHFIVDPEKYKKLPDEFKEYHPIVNASKYLNSGYEKILYLRALLDDEDRPAEEIASRLQSYIDEVGIQISDILQDANLRIENVVYGLHCPRKVSRDN